MGHQRAVGSPNALSEIFV